MGMSGIKCKCGEEWMYGFSLDRKPYCYFCNSEITDFSNANNNDIEVLESERIYNKYRIQPSMWTYYYNLPGYEAFKADLQKWNKAKAMIALGKGNEKFVD